MAPGDEDPGGRGGTQQRQPVGRAGPGADPLVAAVVEVPARQERAYGVDHGRDAPRIERLTVQAELHHPGHSQPAVERRARHPLRREVQRSAGEPFGGHAEAVTPTCLDRLPHAEPAGQPPELRAVGHDDGVVLLQLAGTEDDGDASGPVLQVRQSAPSTIWPPRSRTARARERTYSGGCRYRCPNSSTAAPTRSVSAGSWARARHPVIGAKRVS